MYHVDVPETLQPEPSGDPVTVSLLQHMTSPPVARDTVSSLPVPPIVQASARLSEMDAQLAALQRIADHMEMEFANSRLVSWQCRLSPSWRVCIGHENYGRTRPITVAVA